MQDFRKVRVWESATLVAAKTRELVAGFPRRGYTELRDQMISAAESIVNNIAEGRAASSAREFLRFLDMAARSASELSSQIELAKGYGIVDPRAAFALIGSIICTRRMIRSLQDAIRESERPREQTRQPREQTKKPREQTKKPREQTKKPRRDRRARKRGPKRRPPTAD